MCTAVAIAGSPGFCLGRGGKGSCMYWEVWGIPLKENIEILGPLNRNLRGKIPPIELHLFLKIASLYFLCVCVCVCV